ncbi:hypothetical protein [Bacillus sp. V59.32b]|uniref:hypothetical protein n=1 Tax=Bacillus sp. V59.32b TaxID=1758642 RepID=UPI0013578053|nr:hypothetical protein [Bacillus sp. V59.32b]
MSIKKPLGMILNVLSLPAKGLIKTRRLLKNNTVIGSAVVTKEFPAKWVTDAR